MSIDQSNTDGIDLSPSARYIVYVLEDFDGSLRRDRLLEETELGERTLDRTVTLLEEKDIVRRDPVLTDLRAVRITLENADVSE